MKNKVYKLCFIFITILLVFIFNSKLTRALEPNPWVETSPLTDLIASHVSYYNSGKMGVLGGATSFVTSSYSYSTIEPDGSLSSWTQSSLSYPQSIYWHSVSNKDNYIYVLAGATYPPSQSSTQVRVGHLSSGLIDNWTSLPDLLEPRSLGNSTIVGNRLYYAGGYVYDNGSFAGASSNIYMADINPEGTIDGWEHIGDLPYALYGFGMISSGNKITIIGGFNADVGFQDYSSAVFETTVDPVDGSLSDWVPKDPLPLPIYRAGITKIGNYVVSVGGYSFTDELGNHITDGVYFTPIDENGSIGEWQTAAPFPAKYCCGSLAASDTHLYYTGGHDYGGSYFDTVYYASINDVVGTPSPTPEPEINLNVPDLKQYYSPASLWGNDPYDHLQGKTIESVGCALTSAAMVLRYYNHDVFPGELNQWLIDHPHGYNREGWVNWATVAVFTKQNAKKINPLLPLKHLEWKRISQHDDNIVDGQLTLTQPVILNVPGHFVVAKGKTNSDYYINDPASNSFSLLSQTESYHGGPYWKIETFNPTNTDFSYIYLLVDPGIQMEVYDPNDNKIEDGYSVEEPITSDDGLNNPSGLPLNSFALPKPNNGFYKVSLSGDTNYQLDAYLYDTEGNSKLLSFEGSVEPSQDDLYLISFDRDNSSDQTISAVNIDSILEDLDMGNENGKITNQGIYNSLIHLVVNTQKLKDKDNKFAAKVLLEVVLARIEFFTPQFIDPTFSDYIIKKLNILLTNL